ncbi:MAG: NUDIX domain-containing protein, partial [Bacilli bacterium]|nr:NUDIX domain-containing protein [Bacilli bacterium]
MMRNSKVILTNMCMLYKEDGTFLVMDRKKQDWPGINFPGGHVEDEESISESVIREMKEETGYDLHSVEECGYFEWNVPKEG